MMILLLILMISTGNLALGFAAGIYLGHGPREHLRRYLPSWLMPSDDPTTTGPSESSPT